MKTILRAVYGVSAETLAAALAGCSIDPMIWDSVGSQNIQMTDKLVNDLSTGESSEAICNNSLADLGEASEGSGLSAGECRLESLIA
ncbi:hypothetical protein [Glutamicibacter arilaitensis]|uniref:hypothetical protein n=1 Tax=Glutamicibacter arilaitensis TaxID=256701 RepID=UPI00384AD28E